MRVLSALVLTVACLTHQAMAFSPCIGPETELSSAYNHSLMNQAMAQAQQEGLQAGTADFLLRLSGILHAPTTEMQQRAEQDKAATQDRVDACRSAAGLKQ